MPTLLDPLRIGSLEVPNRIFMAPLTRCRAEPGDVPGDLIATHYAQRAGAGLIIAEATMAIAGNCAFMGAPGVHSEAQVAGWAKVTSAVHAAGGRIYLQLWHGGRACHSRLNGGAQPVAPTAAAIPDGTIRTPDGPLPYETPRALEDAEIPGIVEGFRKAAENAKRAGFDGVEMHGANGYLLDQFLRDGCNRRGGPYGGSIPNRARLMFEAVDAAAAAFGHGRVGLRISPLNSFNGMHDGDPEAVTRHVAEQAAARGLSYLHVMRADFAGKQHGDVLAVARSAFPGALVGNMGYTPEEAASAVASGGLDAVAFGRPFIANPDLPARIRAHAPLAEADPATFYTPGPHGYVDYPAMPAA